MQDYASAAAVDAHDVLIVDAQASVREYVSRLTQDLRVTAVHTWDAAIASLARMSPALVVTELDLDGGSGEELCRAAKNLAVPPTVLVTTSIAERAPTALVAGCDAVLLKPFAPNLLYARVGFLLRERSMALRLRAARQAAKSAHLMEKSALLVAGTNRVWPHTHCPYCQHVGVTSFDHTSYRREWYACLACSKVWIAKRLEH
jgi:DNA-binding response OmpR family regulator